MVATSSILASMAALTGLTSAAPSLSYTPPKEFYITTKHVSGKLDLTGYYLQTYHTGAGLADAVFTRDTHGSKALLNGSNLQIDTQNQFPFGVIASIADTNYARWEPTSIEAGYGSGNWILNGTQGLQLNDQEFGGWLVCEWFHGANIPQLFTVVSSYAGEGPGAPNPPSTCANVLLIPEFVD